MKNLFRTLSVLTALSLTAFAYAAEEKKGACCDKEKKVACCDKEKADCGKDSSCDTSKAEKAKAEKAAPKK